MNIWRFTPQSVLSLQRTLTALRDERGEGNLVSVVGIAAAVALAVALIKPFIVRAFELAGSILIDLLIRVSS